MKTNERPARKVHWAAVLGGIVLAVFAGSYIAGIAFLILEQFTDLRRETTWRPGSCRCSCPTS